VGSCITNESKSILVLLPLVSIGLIVGLISLISPGTNTTYSQQAMDMTNKTSNKHAVHTIDNLVISEHIPLTGQLAAGDYTLLMDFTPFTTSVEGHSHIALKVPCGQDMISKVSIATGIGPKLKTLGLGNAIINGTVDDKKVALSTPGRACLFQSDLPNGITDIVLINTSNESLDFDAGRYSVTVSIHGTAIQHGVMAMP
jgi:hypothetical protein